MGVDALLAAALSLVAGTTLPLAPLAAVLGFCAALVLVRRALGPRRALYCAALFGVGALRAWWALHAYDERRFELRDALGGPRRCAFAARVAASPVKLNGTLSFVAEVSSADCEGRRLTAFRARLYAEGGPSELARGDQISGVADLAPTQLFRNFGAPDPRPGAARSGVLASGGALALVVEQRGLGVRHFIDRARSR
ncbi:MAG TPA: DUF4131 domain-containing protein, partial [Polyangiaceae bacterium]